MTVRSKSGLFASDEELGKRNDDHKPSKMGMWNIKHRPALRKRRIFGALAACLAIYLFIYYIPTDVGPHPAQLRQPPHQAPRQAPKAEKQAFAAQNGELAAGERLERTAPVLQSKEESGGQKLNYNGPIKFYELAGSLKEAASEESADEMARNVVFAASDLSAASAIIPIACEMGSWKRNMVHFAIMGPSEQSLDTIKHVNGATEESCHITWHDARPDYGTVSSHGRMANAIAGAIGHIGKFLQPVAFLTASLDYEEPFFELGLRRKLKEHRFTHIEVPKKDPMSLGWLARLDAAALSAWHDATFDIMVQAPIGASASIIRLLKSLAAADYRGFNPPRLTVELPHQIDERTQNFLRIFEWPPRLCSRPDQNVQLTLRRRITEQRTNVAEASRRFIESFYPTAPSGPHVLLLSPQVELSPKYFHYLKLLLLEFKHSGHAFATSRDIFGLSLEAPSSFLNGSIFSMPAEVKKDSPFRWQAPNGHAALYFADKWIEAHSFLTKRHSATYNPKAKAYLHDNAKLVSTESPAWLEYFLEFMRNRGWSLHYPALPSDSAPNLLSVVHNELSQTPEEFQAPPKLPAWEDVPPPSDSVLTVRDHYLSSQNSPSTPYETKNTEGPLLRHLDALLPPPPSKHADDSTSEDYLSSNPPPFPRLADLPLLDNLGQVLEPDDLLKRAESVRIHYRQHAGGCTAARAEEKEKEMYPFQAEDLFCFDEDRLAAGSPAGVDLGDRAGLDTETDDTAANAAPAPDSGTKTQHVPGGDGAAAAVDRVQNPAHYEETARAGFQKKKSGGGSAAVPAVGVPVAAAVAEAAISEPKPDSEREPQQPSTTTPETQAQQPAVNPVLAVDRVQNPQRYEETARAGFAKKLSGAAAKARQEQDASKNYLRADAGSARPESADQAKKSSEAAAKARKEQDASKDYLRDDTAAGSDTAGAGAGGTPELPNRADAGSSKAPSDGGVGAKPAAAGAIPNPVADANQVKAAAGARNGDSQAFPVIDPANPVLGDAKARGDEMRESQETSGTGQAGDAGSGAVVGGKVGGKVGRIRVGDENTPER